MAAATTPPSEGVGFLDLPPELRNMIYYYAVVEDDAIHILYTDWYKDKGLVVPNQPALARTCKQIREEILPVFYGEKSFVYHLDVDTEQYIHKDTDAWTQACEPYVSLIRSVGVWTLRRYWTPYDPNDDIFDGSEPTWGDGEVTKEYYMTVTLIGSGDEVVIDLGGDLEDQCVCYLPQGDWYSAISHSRAAFITTAMEFCREEVRNRLSTERTCSQCGCPYGTNQEDIV